MVISIGQARSPDQQETLNKPCYRLIDRPIDWMLTEEAITTATSAGRAASSGWPLMIERRLKEELNHGSAIGKAMKIAMQTGIT